MVDLSRRLELWNGSRIAAPLLANPKGYSSKCANFCSVGGQVFFEFYLQLMVRRSGFCESSALNVEVHLGEASSSPSFMNDESPYEYI